MKEREDSDVAESVSLLSPSPFPSPFPSLLSLFSLLVSSATRYRNRVRISTRPRQKGSTRWPWLASTFTRPVFRSRGTDAALFHVRRFQRSQQHAARASVCVCVCLCVRPADAQGHTGTAETGERKKKGEATIDFRNLCFFLRSRSPLSSVRDRPRFHCFLLNARAGVAVRHRRSRGGKERAAGDKERDRER